MGKKFFRPHPWPRGQPFLTRPQMKISGVPHDGRTPQTIQRPATIWSVETRPPAQARRSHADRPHWSAAETESTRFPCSLALPGVLADCDRGWLEVAAHLRVQFRADPVNFHPARLLRLTSCLSALGLSPADASRVAAALPAKVHNPFDE